MNRGDFCDFFSAWFFLIFSETVSITCDMIIVCTDRRHTQFHRLTYEKQIALLSLRKLNQNIKTNFHEKVLKIVFRYSIFFLKVRLSAASAQKVINQPHMIKSAMLVTREVTKVVSTHTVFRITFYWEFSRYRNKCEQVKSKW